MEWRGLVQVAPQGAVRMGLSLVHVEGRAVVVGCVCGFYLWRLVRLYTPMVRAWRGLSWLCNVGIGNNTWLRVACWGCCRHVSARQVYVRHMSGVRLVWLGWIPACAATS